MGLLLVAFFVSSSALSRWKASAKSIGAEFSQSAGRDARQVLANGSVPAAVAVAFGVAGGTGSPGSAALFAAFVGALAAATADTWATEVGLLAPDPPRLITTGLPTAPGTSGAVTKLGSAAAAAGATFIGLTAGVTVAVGGLVASGVPDLSGFSFGIVAAVAGLAGATVDSWLGATVQTVRRCPRCEIETERERHGCGTPTRAVRGWSWLSADFVNLLCGLTGALVALLLQRLVFG
jgi:uncharacterized protein (TIGR00297 family)